MWRWRFALLALLLAPVAVLAALLAVLDKGLEFSSTSGRLEYWGDLARLLMEYLLTGGPGGERGQRGGERLRDQS